MTESNKIVSFRADEEIDNEIPEADATEHHEPVLDVEEQLDTELPDAAPAQARTIKKPVPPAAKYGLIAILVIGAGIVGYNLIQYQGALSGDAEAEPEPWQVANTQLQGSIDTRVDDLSTSLTSAFEAADAAAETRITEALTQASQTSLENNAALSQRVDSLENAVVAINTRIDEQSSLIGAMKAHLDQLLEQRGADSSFIRDEVRRAVQKYDRKFTQLSEDIVRGGAVGDSSAAYTTSKILAPASVPFQILSMDLWGGKPQLAIRDNEMWTFLRVGDTHRGWTVASADWGAGTVGLLGPDQERYSLALPNNSTNVASNATSYEQVAVGEKPTLTVMAEPANATIKVMNIVPKYHANMPLKPGAYDILVRKPGYQTHRRWIQLGDRDRVLHVMLMKQ